MMGEVPEVRAMKEGGIGQVRGFHLPNFPNGWGLWLAAPTLYCFAPQCSRRSSHGS